MANYKRKKKAVNQRCKRKEHHSKSIVGWHYGGQIARNIIKRQEFLVEAEEILK